MADDTYSIEGPQCPYCLRQYTADEPGYYDEQRYTEETCDSCNRTFSVSVNHSTAWSCKPIEAGGDSGWQQCPKCGGDCSAANPPIYDCPMIGCNKDF